MKGCSLQSVRGVKPMRDPSGLHRGRRGGGGTHGEDGKGWRMDGSECLCLVYLDS